MELASNDDKTYKEVLRIIEKDPSVRKYVEKHGVERTKDRHSYRRGVAREETYKHLEKAAESTTISENLAGVAKDAFAGFSLWTVLNPSTIDEVSKVAGGNWYPLAARALIAAAGMASLSYDGGDAIATIAHKMKKHFTSKGPPYPLPPEVTDKETPLLPPVKDEKPFNIHPHEPKGHGNNREKYIDDPTKISHKSTIPPGMGVDSIRNMINYTHPGLYGFTAANPHHRYNSTMLPGINPNPYPNTYTVSPSGAMPILPPAATATSTSAPERPPEWARTVTEMGKEHHPVPDTGAYRIPPYAAGNNLSMPGSYQPSLSRPIHEAINDPTYTAGVHEHFERKPYRDRIHIANRLRAPLVFKDGRSIIERVSRGFLGQPAGKFHNFDGSVHRPVADNTSHLRDNYGIPYANNAHQWQPYRNDASGVHRDLHGEMFMERMDDAKSYRQLALQRAKREGYYTLPPEATSYHRNGSLADSSGGFTIPKPRKMSIKQMRMSKTEHERIRRMLQYDTKNHGELPHKKNPIEPGSEVQPTPEQRKHHAREDDPKIHDHEKQQEEHAKNEEILKRRANNVGAGKIPHHPEKHKLHEGHQHKDPNKDKIHANKKPHVADLIQGAGKFGNMKAGDYIHVPQPSDDPNRAHPNPTGGLTSDLAFHYQHPGANKHTNGKKSTPTPNLSEAMPTEAISSGTDPNLMSSNPTPMLRGGGSGLQSGYAHLPDPITGVKSSSSSSGGQLPELRSFSSDPNGRPIANMQVPGSSVQLDSTPSFTSSSKSNPEPENPKTLESLKKGAKLPPIKRNGTFTSERINIPGNRTFVNVPL